MNHQMLQKNSLGCFLNKDSYPLSGQRLHFFEVTNKQMHILTTHEFFYKKLESIYITSNGVHGAHTWT